MPLPAPVMSATLPLNSMAAPPSGLGDLQKGYHARSCWLACNARALPAAGKAGKLASPRHRQHKHRSHARSDPAAKIGHWLAHLERALAAGEAEQTLALFQTRCFWRDMVAFTWNIKTMEGKAEIAPFLLATLAHTRALNFRIEGEARETNEATEARFTFETSLCNGRGHLRLQQGKCFTLLTTATALKGHEEKGWPAARERRRRPWHPSQAKKLARAQAPRAGRARLFAPALLRDRRRRPGRHRLGRAPQPLGGADHRRSSRMRAPATAGASATSRCACTIRSGTTTCRYLPLPDHWPVFTPKDKLGDWLEMYVKVMELNYWTSSVCRKADATMTASKEWSVARRAGRRAPHAETQAAGIGDGHVRFPEVPNFPGREASGASSTIPAAIPAGEAYAGKRCVVIGSNNSAHDIAADLWEHGADVTMVQRSPTVVVRSETLIDKAHGALYSEAALEKGIGTDVADLTLASIPHRLVPERAKVLYQEIRERDQDLYDRLEAAGFWFDFGVDGSGIHAIHARRGSGYYIDVGASELIADGRIKLRSRVAVERITPTSVSYERRQRAPRRPHCLCHRLWLHERMGRAT